MRGVWVGCSLALVACNVGELVPADGSVSLDAPAPSVVITPAAFDVGNVTVGEISALVPFTITSAGPLVPSLTGGGEFQIVGGNCAASSSPCTVWVVFAPTSVGPKSAELRLGTATATISGTASIPGLSMTPASTDFGSVPMGTTSAPTTFTVTNTGGASSATLATSIVAPFEIGANTCAGSTLPPGGTCTVEVRVSPTVPGTISGILQVGGGTISVSAPLGAAAISSDNFNAVSPTLVDFHDITVGATSNTHQVTVSNQGAATHGPLSLTVAGADAGAFAVVADTCTGTSLGPGVSCTIGVTFTPLVAGMAQAFVSVSSAPGGTSTVGIRGNGTPVPVASSLRRP